MGPARRALGRWELPAAARASGNINGVLCVALSRPRTPSSSWTLTLHASSSWANEGRSNAEAGHWQLFHLHAAGPGSLTWLHREAVTL